MLWIKFRTWLKGESVGFDAFGNRYYRERGKEPKHEKRWVIYKGVVEASKVPPEWHGWIHHRTDVIPAGEKTKRWAWERNYLPNLTGTPYAHRPRGHFLRDGVRARATGDYEAWSPDKEMK